MTQPAAPAGSSRPTVAIVGGGASGTLAALQLLRQAARPLQVVLCDRGPRESVGAAFSTRDPLHLLNVRAGAMSAFPDAPQDFVAWLAEHREPGESQVEAGQFVARRRYGAYLRDRLRQAASGARPGVTLEVVRETVARVAPDPPRLELRSGRTMPVDRVVLALGNFHPRALPLRGPAGTVRDDPWVPSALEGLRPAGGVLLVGTGLTMVDAVVSLVA
ncbi:MAG: FAD/NAD(P)-binding protein, partial [Chloroflexi bacterium]|nr:FAD/NAD(P)-binding protein [Chloroflexota bacterium]